jgi:hypothetical protein
MGQNITNTSVSEYEEFQMEEIVPDFILVTTYFILGSAGNIAIIWHISVISSMHHTIHVLYRNGQ